MHQFLKLVCQELIDGLKLLATICFQLCSLKSKTSMIDKKDDFGVYCLGNDNVLDWLITFLESFRCHEPEVNLKIIPFDDKIEKLERLSSKYNFSVLTDESLSTLDSIGHAIHPDKYSDAHTFRKFAAFWGPFEKFLFLDSDIVVLSQLDILLQPFLQSDFDLMHYDTSLNYVYKPGDFRNRMVSEFGSTSFNTGCFAATNTLLTLDDVKDCLTQALAIKENFACGGEQPFLNYCVDIKKTKRATFFEKDKSLCKWTWANQKPIRHVNEKYCLMSPHNPNYGKQIPFLHWSGILISPFMPNRKLFLKYRLKNLSRLEKAKYIVFDWWKPVTRVIVKKVRRKKGMV